MTSSGRFALPGFLMLAAAWASAIAADDLRPMTRENWLIAAWQTEQGLPQNAVSSVLQTRGGYLWIGTYNGLARFDGVSFTVFNAANTPGLGSARIVSLFEDGRETLWAGQETGELARCEGGRWSQVKLPPGWPGGSVRDIATDAGGAIWLLHPSGLLMRLGDGLVIPPLPGDPADANVSFTRDSGGGLWILRNLRLFQLRGDTLEPWTAPDSKHGAKIRRAAASRSGGLWLVMEDRLLKWRDGAWAEDLGTCDWGAEDNPLAMREMLSGEVVVGTLKSGLHGFSPGGKSWSLGWKDGLANDWVKVMTEDHEGNLWIGTAGGLNRLRTRRVAMVRAPDFWQGAPLRAVAGGRDGEMWIATEGAGVYRLKEGNFDVPGSVRGLTNPYMWTVLVDRENQLWSGSWGDGLMLRGGDGFAPAPGWREDAKIVTALYEARDGAIWVGSERGLARWISGMWTWYTHAGPEPLRQVRTILEDASGQVWFGMSGGGLGRIRDGGVSVWRQKDGLASDYVWTLAAEPDGSLWIGTFGGGLCRWKNGRFATLTKSQGLPGNEVCHLADDGMGHFWISSYSGIYRVRKSELTACADGETKSVSCLVLSTSDGLASLECSGGFQPSGLRMEDGRLWFPTSKGLAVIDPARIEPHLLPPPVLIEKALLDDRADDGSADGEMIIPPGRHRVEIRYTGLSFTAPEKVRFRYRLANFDAGWVDAGTARAATYNYLPAGGYDFEVLACNDDGVWSNSPARLSLTVEAPFWQTWWFRTAAVAGGVLLLAAAYRWRIRHIGEVQQLRLRIARDLHDEVGGNLSSIALLSEMFEQQPNASDAGEVRRIAVRTVDLMKEIVWLTNPAYDRLSALIPKMRETARQMLVGISHEILTEGLPADLLLPPSWRHNLMPIFKETLHNAARHARPGRVVISLRLDRRNFELRVEDDGCGFDSGKVLPGDGLLNLHRRAREMGGEILISPAPGGGTLVRLLVRLP